MMDWKHLRSRSEQKQRKVFFSVCESELSYGYIKRSKEIDWEGVTSNESTS